MSWRSLFLIFLNYSLSPFSLCHLITASVGVKIVFGVSLGWCLMAGEFGVASESVSVHPMQGGNKANFEFSQPEEIQEQVIAPQVKPLALKGLGYDGDLVIADVYFDEQRLLLDTQLQDFFLQMAEWLAQEPQGSLRLEAHCDPRGPSAYNFARAGFHLSILVDYLAQLGIRPQQVVAVNYGQNPLRCQDTSEQCQEENLRAEKIFPIFSLGNTQRGCLARLRQIGRDRMMSILPVSQRFPSLQRIFVASPSFAF